ncbi:hypothetical protein [Roseivivax sp. CAU 1753]
MPLEILIALVVAGILGIAALTHLLGLSTPRRFDDATARTAFLREYPEIPIRQVTLAENRHAALLATDAGPALVWAMGADSCARMLSDVRTEETPHGLLLHLPDITAPRIRLTLDPSERAHWQHLTGAAA